MRGKKINELIRPRTGEVLSFKTRQYYCFSDGRLFDNSRKRFIKQREYRGYMQVALRDDNGKQQTRLGVHDLVASVFIRLLEQGENTHHVDKNPANNNLSNLVIISASEHQRKHTIEKWQDGTFDGNSAKMKKAWADGRFVGNGEKLKKAWVYGRYYGVPAKLSVYMKKAWKEGTFDCRKKQIAQLSLDGHLVKVWPSTCECGRNGHSQGHVSACCRGERKKHHGYRWMFYQDYLAQQETPKEQWESRQLFFDFSE